MAEHVELYFAVIVKAGQVVRVTDGPFLDMDTAREMSLMRQEGLSSRTCSTDIRKVKLPLMEWFD